LILKLEADYVCSFFAPGLGIHVLSADTLIMEALQAYKNESDSSEVLCCNFKSVIFHLIKAHDFASEVFIRTIKPY